MTDVVNSESDIYFWADELCYALIMNILGWLGVKYRVTSQFLLSRSCLLSNLSVAVTVSALSWLQYTIICWLLLQGQQLQKEEGACCPGCVDMGRPCQFQGQPVPVGWQFYIISAGLSICALIDFFPFLLLFLFLLVGIFSYLLKSISALVHNCRS